MYAANAFNISRLRSRSPSHRTYSLAVARSHGLGLAEVYDGRRGREIFECAHLKLTVSGRSKQASKHTLPQCSHASVGLAQACPKYLPRARMREWLLKQSVRLSVCPVKNFEISTFKGLLYTAVTWQSKRIIDVCVPDRDQSSSPLCISSSFLFNVSIVHHFDTVNHLDAVKTGHVLTPSTCSRHQPSRSQDGEKLGEGLGTRQRVHLGAQVSEIWRVIKNPNAPTRA